MKQQHTDPIDLSKSKADFLHQFLIQTMANKAEDSSVKSIEDIKGWEGFFKKYHIDGIDVGFQINGVDCDFVQTMRFFEKQFDDLILRKAEQLLEDKLIDITNGIEVIASAVTSTTALIRHNQK